MFLASQTLGCTSFAFHEEEKETRAGLERTRGWSDERLNRPFKNEAGRLIRCYYSSPNLFF